MENIIPDGKKYQPIPDDQEEPYFKYCNCGHGWHYHKTGWKFLIIPFDENCEKCECPKFTSVGVLGWNQAKQFQKKIGVDN